MFLVLCGTTFICTLTFSRRDSPPKSSPTFSVRPRSSVGRITVDLIRRLWVWFPPRSKDFSSPHVVPWFPLLGLMHSGSFMGLITCTSQISTTQASENSILYRHHTCKCTVSIIWLSRSPQDTSDRNCLITAKKNTKELKEACRNSKMFVAL